MKISLLDCMKEGGVVNGEVTQFAGHVCVRLEGYGDKASSDDRGVPIVIEMHEGDVRVIVWSDINQEDPTHIISLAKAKLSNRVEE